MAIDFNPLDYFKSLAQSEKYRKYLGGSPSNIAVGLARLNKKVGFIGKVSDDRFGDYVTEFFNKEGIDTSNIFRAKNGEKLGLTFTEILSPDESSTYVQRGSGRSYAEPSVNEDYIKSAKMIVISGTALSLSPSREAALKALFYAKKNSTKVLFDIDYRPYSWKNKDEISIYYSLVAASSDIIMGSREDLI